MARTAPASFASRLREDRDWRALLTGCGEAARRAVAWWTGELAACAAPLTARLRSPPPIIRVGPAGAVLEDGARSWARATVAGLSDHLGATSRARFRGGVQLLLARELGLVQSERIPAAAMSRAGGIVALSIERTTPFRQEDVAFGWRRAVPAVASSDDGAWVGLDVAIVKAAAIRSSLETIRALRIDVADVSLETTSGSIPLVLPASLKARRSRLARGLAAAEVVTCLAAALSLVIALKVGDARIEAAGEALDARIAAATREATAVRRLYDTTRQEADALDAALRSRNARPTIIALLAELTRLMPDDTWLTELDVAENAVRAGGLSAQPAGLIAALEASPLLSAVAFAAPVTRSPLDAADRFSLTIQVEAPSASEPAS